MVSWKMTIVIYSSLCLADGVSNKKGKPFLNLFCWLSSSWNHYDSFCVFCGIVGLFSSVQFLSGVWLFATPWITARQASLSITNSWNLLILSVHWVGNAIQPSYPLSSPSAPAFSLSQHQGFFPVSQFFASSGQSIRVFSFSISPSKKYSGLISFRIDWDRFDLLAVQGTLKNLLQHHSSKHRFFGAQLSLWSNSHIHTWLLEKP